MTDTQTDTAEIEDILEAAGAPRHASIYDFEFTDNGNIEIEWAVDE